MGVVEENDLGENQRGFRIDLAPIPTSVGINADLDRRLNMVRLD